MLWPCVHRVVDRFGSPTLMERKHKDREQLACLRSHRWIVTRNQEVA